MVIFGNGEVHWDSFLAGLVPGFLALMFAVAGYIKVLTAARESHVAANLGRKNSDHLDAQDAHLDLQTNKLGKIEVQLSDECMVMKAEAAARRLHEANKSDTMQAAELVIQAARIAAAKVAESTAEVSKRLHDSQVISGTKIAEALAAVPDKTAKAVRDAIRSDSKHD